MSLHGQLANFSAAPLVRAGRLMPLLLPRLSKHSGVHVYYGRRAALPRRVRTFIDLAVERLPDCPARDLWANKPASAAQPCPRTQWRR